MPVSLAVISTLYGAAYGMFPIAWVVFASILLYRIAVDTGKFEIIKSSVGGLTTDRRLQALFIAFSFGAFIEGAAGFGTPVAVSGAMLAGLGFSPFYAAGICLLANTAPVAFGSIGIPVVTLANVTGCRCCRSARWSGGCARSSPVFIPGYLLVVMVGWKRAMEVLPAIIACGVSFAGVQFYVSNYMGPELTDILSSLACIIVMVFVLKFWKPKNILRLPDDKPVIEPRRVQHGAGEVFMAWMPYLLLVVFVLAWGEPSMKAVLDKFSDRLLPRFLPHATALNGINVPGLHNLITRVPPVTPAPAPYAAVFAWNWLTASGTACLFAAMLTAAFLGVGPCGSWAPTRPPSSSCRSRWSRSRRCSARVLDELLGHDLHARARAGGQRTGVSVLQRHARLAGRVPDRQRHGLERPLRQSAGRARERDGPEPGADGVGQHRAGVMGKMISVQSIAVAVAATQMSRDDESSCSASRSSTACFSWPSWGWYRCSTPTCSRVRASSSGQITRPLPAAARCPAFWGVRGAPDPANTLLSF
jgi:lactate permease